MSEAADQALRRHFIQVMGLTFTGHGICPGCLQKKEVFARRRVTSGAAKERCLGCWIAER